MIYALAYDIPFGYDIRFAKEGTDIISYLQIGKYIIRHSRISYRKAIYHFFRLKLLKTFLLDTLADNYYNIIRTDFGGNPDDAYIPALYFAARFV